MDPSRIMVVDDDRALLGFTTKYLSRLGYSVAGYRSSEEAWTQFSVPGANYSLVMVDLSLPGLSGHELSRMMLTADPRVRLIVTSGYPFDPSRALEAGDGRIAFLHKPFTPSMLTQMIDRLLRSRDADAD
jgi:DNA-binding NtrC family response regulator